MPRNRQGGPWFAGGAVPPTSGPRVPWAWQEAGDCPLPLRPRAGSAIHRDISSQMVIALFLSRWAFRKPRREAGRS